MGHKLTNEFAIKCIKEKKYSANRMVTVTDNWCPNYPDNKIKVSINIWLREDNKANVAMTAWGMDDDYMTLHSEHMSPTYAICLYETWKKNVFDKVPDECNHKWFFEHGFYYN